jgi:hypothetical protein
MSNYDKHFRYLKSSTTGSIMVLDKYYRTCKWVTRHQGPNRKEERDYLKSMRMTLKAKTVEQQILTKNKRAKDLAARRKANKVAYKNRKVNVERGVC